MIITIVPNALSLPYRITKKILEIRNLWIYGFEKPYTIIELRELMRNAGVTPIKTSGVQIISSLFTFLQLISKKRCSDHIVRNMGSDVNTLKSNTSKIKKLIKKITQKIDDHLEQVFGAFFGKDIGIKGYKK